ncbi:hypothetical protein [Microlunatus flavus]|uniref:Uncharacterized protein n=1 Tax=Microlunatus flavus TaxID=1036181 RepID=A0A1H9GC01_9ACTN|nr:hypothetical protein [Microlunatus flavus]SEQ47616.1 hypothetical protein SAMN05421756_103576 [Microlunatus flavus]
MWLRPTWSVEPGPGRRLLLGWVGPAWAAAIALVEVVDPEGPSQVLALVLTVPGLLSPLAVLLTRGSRGLSFVLAGAGLADARGEA